MIATLRLSWRKVQSDEDACSVMQAISELAPESVPLSFLSNVKEFRGEEGDKRLRLAVDKLVSHSMLDQAGESAIIAHRLMLGFVNEFDPCPHHLREPVIEAVSAEMNRIYEEERIVETARELVAVAPHAAALCESDRCSSADKRSLAMALSNLDDFRGRYREALRWAEFALSKTPSNQPDDRAGAKRRVASCHYALHDYRESERLYREILTFRINQGDPAMIGIAQYSLALPLSNLGLPELREGRELAEKSLKTACSQIPPDLRNIATSQALLGDVLLELNELRSAKAYLEAACTGFERIAKDHPYLPIARSYLSGALIALGDFAGAKELERANLAVFVSSFQTGHPYIAVGLFHLARALLYCNDLPQARAQTEFALSEMRDYWGPDDSWTIRAQAQIAIIKIKMGEDQAGWRELQEAQEKLRRLGDRCIDQSRKLQRDMDRLLPGGPSAV